MHTNAVQELHIRDAAFHRAWPSGMFHSGTAGSTSRSTGDVFD